MDEKRLPRSSLGVESIQEQRHAEARLSLRATVTFRGADGGTPLLNAENCQFLHCAR